MLKIRASLYNRTTAGRMEVGFSLNSRTKRDENTTYADVTVSEIMDFNLRQ